MTHAGMSQARTYAPVFWNEILRPQASKKPHKPKKKVGIKETPKHGHKDSSLGSVSGSSATRSNTEWSGSDNVKTEDETEKESGQEDDENDAVGEMTIDEEDAAKRKEELEQLEKDAKANQPKVRVRRGKYMQEHSIVCMTCGRVYEKASARMSHQDSSGHVQIIPSSVYVDQQLVEPPVVFMD